jgi:hypothetical protein
MKCNNIFTMISNSIPGFRGSFSFVIKYQYLVVLKLLLPNLFISFQDKKPFQSENTKSNKSNVLASQGGLDSISNVLTSQGGLDSISNVLTSQGGLDSISNVLASQGGLDSISNVLTNITGWS